MTLPGQVEFLNPWVLLALLALPWLAWRLGKHAPVPSVRVPSIAPLAALGQRPRRHAGRWRAVPILAAVGLMVVALARPRAPRGDTPDPSKGIDIMLCLDFSRSMAEEDFRLQGKRVSRRKALETVTSQFVEGRPNDRIGIVCFARSPFLVSPLTLDHKWALNALRETDLATGTGIGWALMASANFLRKDSDRSKVIILVTDGENSTGPRASDVVQLAVQGGIKVYAVLIGPEVVTPSAAAGHDLNRTARVTGGQFFQATDSRALQGIYGLIDQLEKRELIQKRYVAWRELYPWPAGAAALLVVAGVLASEALRRRIP
jgi:Ca-activated chloride channel family protein